MWFLSFMFNSVALMLLVVNIIIMLYLDNKGCPPNIFRVISLTAGAYTSIPLEPTYSPLTVLLAAFYPRYLSVLGSALVV
jgi:hypothetical protein